jgi:hypothetical protein
MSSAPTCCERPPPASWGRFAAEDLCRLAHQDRRLACVVLRLARFFPTTPIGASGCHAEPTALYSRGRPAP